MRRNYDAPALGPQGSDFLLIADQSFYLNFPPPSQVSQRRRRAGDVADLQDALADLLGGDEAVDAERTPIEAGARVAIQVLHEGGGPAKTFDLLRENLRTDTLILGTGGGGTPNSRECQK